MQAAARTTMGSQHGMTPFFGFPGRIGLRGSPWKTTPTTLVKQARASPPMTARLTMASKAQGKVGAGQRHAVETAHVDEKIR
jgi:hypothetical protein